MADINRALDMLEVGTYKPGSGQVVWWEYWDRLIFPLVNNQFSYFAIPQGQGGKTKSDTNWTLAGQMPASEKMAVMYMAMYYCPHAALTQTIYQNWLDMIKETYIQWNVKGIKDLSELTLLQVFNNPMPALVTGAVAGDQLAGRSMFTAIYEFEIEIVIAAQTPMTVDLFAETAPEAALDDDELYFSMIGPKLYLS